MTHTVTTHLTPDEAALRVEVFLIEQGFKVEFDELDVIDRSVHITLADGSETAAVCRIYPTENAGEWAIGRVAVKRKFRGTGLGREVMRIAESECIARGATRLTLSAQTQAQGFYEACGYVAEGDTYLDEHCPHVRMNKLV